MALGRKRVGICLEYKEQKYPIEIKIFRNNKSITDGLEQTFEYMEKCGSDEGWLVVFDRDNGKPWEKNYICVMRLITVKPLLLWERDE